MSQRHHGDAFRPWARPEHLTDDLETHVARRAGGVWLGLFRLSLVEAHFDQMGVGGRILLVRATGHSFLVGATNIQRPGRRPFDLLGDVRIRLRLGAGELPGLDAFYAAIFANGFLLRRRALLFVYRRSRALVD